MVEKTPEWAKKLIKDVVELKKQTSVNCNKLTKLDTKLSTVNTQLAGVNDRVEINSNKLTKLSTKVSTMNAQIGSINGRLNSVESHLVRQDKIMTKIQKKI